MATYLFRNSQGGSALLVSLVFLLLLSLMAVSALSGATLQERMAHNVQRAHTSFQAAESGLRHVEQQLRSHELALPAVVCREAACEVPATALSPATRGAPGPDWHSVPGGGAGSEVAVWYRVVLLGESVLAGKQTPGASSTLYRVSVVSQRDATRTLLEAVYAYSHL